MRALVVALALGLPGLVHAAGFGVVVSGDPSINAATETAVTAWLTAHAFQISPSPLSADGTLTLSNCLALTDMNCARGVVEARASVTSLVAVVTQLATAHGRRTIQLSAYWFAKARDVVSVQRTCDACTDALLAQTIDSLMADLARLTPAMHGHIKVASTPAGVLVAIDDTTVGVTPLVHEVTAGPHDVSLTRDGTELAKRHVDVAPGTTADLAVPVTVANRSPAPIGPQHHRSHAVPVTMLVLGAAAIATGAVMYGLGGPTGDKLYYRDLRTPGIGVAAGGGALALVGVIVLLAGGSSNTPTVAIAPGGVVAGWARSF